MRKTLLSLGLEYVTSINDCTKLFFNFQQCSPSQSAFAETKASNAIMVSVYIPWSNVSKQCHIPKSNNKSSHKGNDNTSLKRQDSQDTKHSGIENNLDTFQQSLKSKTITSQKENKSSCKKIKTEEPKEITEKEEILQSRVNEMDKNKSSCKKIKKEESEKITKNEEIRQNSVNETDENLSHDEDTKDRKSNNSCQSKDNSTEDSIFTIGLRFQSLEEIDEAKITYEKKNIFASYGNVMSEHLRQQRNGCQIGWLLQTLTLSITK